MSEENVFFTAEFWVFVAFVIFCLVLYRMQVHKSALSAIDQRGARIQAELDQAKSLREEAQRVLADYQSRLTEAQKEAQGIIAAAEAEAARLSADAMKKSEEFVARRTQMAEEKIKLAETQAVADVRDAAAEAAAAAAGIVLATKVKGEAAGQLVDRGIAELKSRFQ